MWLNNIFGNTVSNTGMFEQQRHKMSFDISGALPHDRKD
jgi:hypothetical protein